MILGYNKERPALENYLDFENKLVEGFSRLNIEGLSLMFYGSYVRGDYNPGRSDIDAVMIFPDDVIINKLHLHEASKVLRHALKGNNVPFQVTVTDIVTMIDGRFNTYDKSFKPYFDSEAKILIGPDYRKDFKFELPTFDEQVPVRFNLRKARSGLLFAEHDYNEDYDEFLRKFNRTLDAVSRSSKQILFFSDNELRKNRFSAIDAIRERYPEVDVAPLIQIKRLYTDLKKLDTLYNNPIEIKQLWNSSITCMEEMLRAYIRSNPRI